MTSHNPEDVAAFQESGERRLLFARYVENPSAPLFYLEDGKAAEVREWAKVNLECPMPECDARALTTVSRSTRRDGFRHSMDGAGHHFRDKEGRERFDHFAAKMLVAKWVNSYGTETGETDRWHAEVEVTTENRARRADVLATGPTVEKVAVEIQYSPINIADWTRRTESYLEQSICPVWLFGHDSPYLRMDQRSADDEHLVRLSDLPREIIKVGHRIMFINPHKELLAGLRVRRSDGTETEVTPDDQTARVHIWSLRDSLLSAAGIEPPDQKILSQMTDEWLAAQPAEDQRQAELAQQPTWDAPDLSDYGQNKTAQEWPEMVEQNEETTEHALRESEEHQRRREEREANREWFIFPDGSGRVSPPKPQHLAMLEELGQGTHSH